MNVVVVDYGIVNIKNIVRGLEYVGAKVIISKEPETIEKAGRVILPGVGAFAAGMRELNTLGLDEALKNVAKAGQPILGICLGMQMLLTASEEYGHHKGLGLIPGSVLPIPTGEEGAVKQRKVPHIGWTALYSPPDCSNWDDSCLSGTPFGAFFYFVHSFMAVPDNPADILGHCDYESLSVIAAVKNENVTGLQFHPERSGLAGLAVLQQFVST